MLNSVTLLSWDGKYVLIDSKPTCEAILSVDPLIQAVSNLPPKDYISCVAYCLQYDEDTDTVAEDDLRLISDNLASMLNDDTLVISEKHEFSIVGVENRKMGIAQHIQDIKRYYERHPFIA